MKTVFLTRGQVAIVDDEDFEKVSKHKWYALARKGGGFYAARGVRPKDAPRGLELLHNFILGVKGVDHKDGEGLDNRRENIRPATKQQNAAAFRRKGSSGSSRYRGVSWHCVSKKWIARIRVCARLLHLGYHNSEVEAGRAYDVAAKKHFGEFATLNFI